MYEVENGTNKTNSWYISECKLYYTTYFIKLN